MAVDITLRLQAMDNNKLMDVVKNHRQYGYSDSIRNTAIEILKSRGVLEEDLILTGNFSNKQYDLAREIAADYSFNAQWALVFYILILLTRVGTAYAVHGNETLAWTFLIGNLLSIFLFFVFLIKSFLNHNEFYKTINKNTGTGDFVIYFLVGMPLYLFMFFYYKNQLKEELQAFQDR